MDRPPPDPRKLLNEWMEWERGEATPGRVMANLKTAGIRDLLEVLAEQAEAMKRATADAADPAGSADAADAAGSSSPDAAGSSSPDAAGSPSPDAAGSSSADATPAWTPTV